MRIHEKIKIFEKRRDNIFYFSTHDTDTDTDTSAFDYIDPRRVCLVCQTTGLSLRYVAIINQLEKANLLQEDFSMMCCYCWQILHGEEIEVDMFKDERDIYVKILSLDFIVVYNERKFKKMKKEILIKLYETLTNVNKDVRNWFNNKEIFKGKN